MQDFYAIKSKMGEAEYRRALTYIPEGSPILTVAHVLDGTRTGRTPGCNQVEELERALVNFGLQTNVWLTSKASAYEMCWLGPYATPMQMHNLLGANWEDVLGAMHTLPKEMQEVYRPVFEMHGVDVDAAELCSAEFHILQIGGTIYHSLVSHDIYSLEQWYNYEDLIIMPTMRKGQLNRASRYVRDFGYHLIRTSFTVSGIAKSVTKPAMGARLEQHFITYYGSPERFLDRLVRERELPVRTNSTATADALLALAKEHHPTAVLKWKQGTGVVLSIL